jgi:hypothetical protein
MACSDKEARIAFMNAMEGNEANNLFLALHERKS